MSDGSCRGCRNGMGSDVEFEGRETGLETPKPNNGALDVGEVGTFELF